VPFHSPRTISDSVLKNEVPDSWDFYCFPLSGVRRALAFNRGARVGGLDDEQCINGTRRTQWWFLAFRPTHFDSTHFCGGNTILLKDNQIILSLSSIMNTPFLLDFGAQSIVVESTVHKPCQHRTFLR